MGNQFDVPTESQISQKSMQRSFHFPDNSAVTDFLNLNIKQKIGLKLYP
jgi:hypothetical protein